MSVVVTKRVRAHAGEFEIEDQGTRTVLRVPGKFTGATNLPTVEIMVPDPVELADLLAQFVRARGKAKGPKKPRQPRKKAEAADARQTEAFPTANGATSAPAPAGE